MLTEVKLLCIPGRQGAPPLLADPWSTFASWIPPKRMTAVVVPLLRVALSTCRCFLHTLSESHHVSYKQRSLSSSYIRENLSCSKRHTNVGGRPRFCPWSLFGGTLSLQITSWEITGMLSSLWRGMLVKHLFKNIHTNVHYIERYFKR